MDIEDLESYTPNSHGEHGVDAVIHNVVELSNDLHEAACEPPGGSWNQVDIVRPPNNETFRWDNLPRRPSSTVKKPDEIIQSHNGDRLEILLIESKKSLSSLDPDIGSKMAEFFEGNSDFVGVRQRPAWHKKPEGGEWSTIPAGESEKIRYWLRDYNNISVLTGFSFASQISSESQSTLGGRGEFRKKDRTRIETDLSDVISGSDVDVAFSVSWDGRFEYPALFVKADEEFKTSLIWTALEQFSTNHNLDITLL